MSDLKFNHEVVQNPEYSEAMHEAVLRLNKPGRKDNLVSNGRRSMTTALLGLAFIAGGTVAFGVNAIDTIERSAEHTVAVGKTNRFSDRVSASDDCLETIRTDEALSVESINHIEYGTYQPCSSVNSIHKEQQLAALVLNEKMHPARSFGDIALNEGLSIVVIGAGVALTVQNRNKA